MQTGLRMLVAGICLSAGCSMSVPQETAILSTTVGRQISALHASQEAWIRAYYDLSRRRVDDFIARRWTPVFMENFVADSQVLAKVAEPGANAEQIMLEFAQAGQDEIERQRASLLAPLNRQEAKALRSLDQVYAQLSQMQSTVTAYIQTAHDVQAEQDRVAERFGLLEAKNDLVDKAIETSDQITAILEAGDDPKEALSRLKTLFDQDGEGE
ncbi:MAG: hypothetical protein OXR73_03635 [Myxococcales bacterium]|nr:hypothetical protein [Myxococcales bacterium]